MGFILFRPAHNNWPVAHHCALSSFLARLKASRLTHDHSPQLEHQLDSASTDAKKAVLASCSSLDQVASYAVSMPHYLSVGTNEATSAAITDVIQIAASGIDLFIEALEGFIGFVSFDSASPILMTRD
jgi:hypothetical protein